MSLIDLTDDIISQCEDLRIAIDVNDVVKGIVRSTETRQFQEDLSEAATQLAIAQAEFERKHAEALDQQQSSLQNIQRTLELKAESIRTAKELEDQLRLNSKRIIDGFSADRRLLLQHIRLKSDNSNHWACLPARILVKVMAFADQFTISSCAAVCSIWRHNLQYSDVYRQILMSRIVRLKHCRATSPDRNQRIVIRIYLSDNNGTSSIAFDKTLAQLQSENQRIASEHENAISRLRQAEFQITELENKIKAARHRFGALSIVRSEQKEELQKLANRKKQLVSQTAEMDRALKTRRFVNMETYLQLQEEMQQQVAESRRLDAVDLEFKRLSENLKEFPDALDRHIKE